MVTQIFFFKIIGVGAWSFLAKGWLRLSSTSKKLKLVETSISVCCYMPRRKRTQVSRRTLFQMGKENSKFKSHKDNGECALNRSQRGRSESTTCVAAGPSEVCLFKLKYKRLIDMGQ